MLQERWIVQLYLESALARGFGERRRVVQVINVLGLQLHAFNIFLIFIKLGLDLLVSPVGMFGMVTLKISVHSCAIPGKFSSSETGRGVIKLSPSREC